METVTERNYINIEDEMRRSYLDYAMSVIIGRALPDVRDGFKPVHRRVLWAMHELGNQHNKPYKKSARIVGDCFVKGALVHTEHGLKPIEEVETGEKVRLRDGSLSPVVEAYHNPPSRVVDVTFANGLTLTVTPGQRFRVLHDDLTTGWERADNLEGKRVLVSNLRAMGTPAHHPDVEKASLAYVCGLLVAEGSAERRCNSTRVSINMTDVEPMRFINEVCSQRQISPSWGQVLPRQSHHKLQHAIRFSGIKEAHEACAPTSAFKTVPPWILNDRRLFAPFVAGFTDGDGYIRNSRTSREVTLVSTSKTLLIQLQAILADSGIHGCLINVSTTEHHDGINRLPSFALSFTGSNASEFCRFVGEYLKVPGKQQLAAQNAVWQSRALNTATECIPSRPVFAELSRAHLGGGWYSGRDGQKFRAGIKYATGSKIRYEKTLQQKDISYRQLKAWGIFDKLTRINSPLAPLIEDLASNYGVMRAVSVNSKNDLVETYDIQIEHESHEFLLHGFAVSNCIGKYHPHGDVAVYDTIVRMAQDFSMRYPLVDGQGNFGCFTGDTKIKLMDGTEKTFAELAELPPHEIFYVYSVDKEGRVIVGEGRHSRVTRREAELLELTLDSGAKIRCTPDHRFLLRDGTYKEAQHLTADDSLMPGYFDAAPVNKRTNDYTRVMQPNTGRYEFVHHIADEYNFKRGDAPEFAGAFVRHHKNFNRLDNRPTNIERMTFLEHLHLHAEQLEELWQTDEFRQAQRDGVKRYYDNHPEVREARRQNFVAQNQDADFRRQNGKRVAASLKRHYAGDEHARHEISARMKALWADADYRAKMSEALAGIEKRPLSPQEKERVARIISAKSRAMWNDEAKRAEITAAISRALSSPEVSAKLSENARRNWRSPEYRAKYGENHFSDMAHALWQDPATRDRHTAKIARQRGDAAFCTSQSEGVRRSNKRRMEADPQMISGMTAKAAASLTRKWREPSYRERVMRQRIARYGSQLLAQFGRDSLTPELYERQRTANWIPRLATTLRYFDNFNDFVRAAQTYNHRVVAKRHLEERADVYDITVDEHHNFLLADGVFVHNSIDGDSPAAMRYTEARMARLTTEILADIEKETVNFNPNYDESLSEPSVLPTRVPNLLLNGSDGIAVGMATKIPPHNLGEIVDATIALIRKPTMKLEELVKLVPGPDFPTGGFIYGREGIRQAYLTGRGIIQMRARAGIDRVGRGAHERDAVIVTEIPYQVNKARLIERIAELVNEKKIEGIADLRDESNRVGMRIVVELKRDAVPQVVLNKLYKLTPMQSSFGVINLAIVGGQPRVLNLKQMLEAFVEFRREVVRRRTEYELRRARARAHILEGLNKAIDALDYIIPLIRNARSVDEARQWLTANNFATMTEVKSWKGAPADMTLAGFLDKLKKTIGRLAFSDAQAQAILDLQLRRLSALERQRILDEYEQIIRLIAELEEILANDSTLRRVIVQELEDVKKDFADKRRTEIIDEGVELSIEDMIADEEVAITVTNSGYIKRTPVTAYTRQGRGGKGRFGASTGKNNDYVEHIFTASTHDYIMIFTDDGQVFKLKVHELPDAPTAARGKAVVNLINIPSSRKLAGVVPVREFAEGRYVVMVTRKGVIKKTSLAEFQNIRSNGINAVNVDEGDELLDVILTDGKKRIFIATHDGLAIRFDEEGVRSMGRAARGVRGVVLRPNDYVVSVCAVSADDSERMLSVSEQGYGKQTKIGDYRLQSRGGRGVINMKATEKTGKVVAVFPVEDESEIMIITQQGKLIRLEAGDIRKTGRSASGVRLIKTDGGDKVTSASLLDPQAQDAEIEATA